MKRTLNFLLALGVASAAPRAQSTMPAMGINTPKGEVAKTDASLNPTSGTNKSNASKGSSKRTSKMKAKKSRAMMVLQ